MRLLRTLFLSAMLLRSAKASVSDMAADVCEPSSMGSSSLIFAGTVDVTNSSNDSNPIVFNISN